MSTMYSMRFNRVWIFLACLDLFLALDSQHAALASRLDELSASDEPVTYEQFLDAVATQQRVEDARLCDEAHDQEAACRSTSEDIIRQKAIQAYEAYIGRLDEQAFQRRQEEDSRDRGEREARIQALFQKEYDEKIAASRDDPTVIELAIGTVLCDHRVNNPNRAVITAISPHRTARLRLYTRTRRGDVVTGSGEVIVRNHSEGPPVYQIEILTVTNGLGQVDLVPLGTTKTVVSCTDEDMPPHDS